MTEYVLGFAFDEVGDNVALIRKLRPEWQCGKFNGIGGHIEAEETPAEAQRREFREETGVDILPHDWRQFGVMSGPAFRVFLFVAYTDKIWSAATQTDEGVAVMTAGPEVYDDCATGRRDLLPNCRWLIPLARDYRRSPSITEVRYES